MNATDGTYVTKNSIHLLARELLAEELGELGLLLDSVELKASPASAEKYLRAARSATRILGKYPKCPIVLNAAATSPALRVIRSNLAMVQAIELGLCELPDEVWRCLSLAPLGRLGSE